MSKKDEFIVDHPELGHVIFYNPTIRQREVLTDYINTKQAIKQNAPFMRAAVQKFNSIGGAGSDIKKAKSKSGIARK